MKSPSTSAQHRLEQVYLLERNSGLLCRLLGLYAARGLDVLHIEYAYAAQDVMTLTVSASNEGEDIAEVVRVLIDKAASFVGVMAACERPSDARRVA